MKINAEEFDRRTRENNQPFVDAAGRLVFVEQDGEKYVVTLCSLWRKDDMTPHRPMCVTLGEFGNRDAADAHAAKVQDVLAFALKCAPKTKPTLAAVKDRLLTIFGTTREQRAELSRRLDDPDTLDWTAFCDAGTFARVLREADAPTTVDT